MLHEKIVGIAQAQRFTAGAGFRTMADYTT